ncbi:MAG TPA: family 16 glycoside hydrolase [Verrucomicrobiae bacterium]|nr:family 16 glycoside hydrolase [Verrucomicrobiae bacterium]
MKTKAGLILVAFLLCRPLAWSQEWESLFDGKTLAGWKASESGNSFRVIDGQIVCDGPRAHLFYLGADGRADFRNFEFSAEVMTQNGANSGIYFHTEFQAQGFPEKGFEAQVLNVPGGEGGYRENKLTGSLYAIRNVYKPLVKDGEWFTMHIRVTGKRIEIHVNDTLVVDYLEADPPPNVPGHPGRKLDHGTFALQCHDPHSKVFYRNLKLRRLPKLPAGSVAAAPALSPYDQEIIRLGADNFPVVNYHTHLKGGLSLAEALASSRATGVFYGIAVNCGLNFSVTNDAGIDDYLRSMQGQPCFVAMQAEGREWVHLFSPQAISRFDYVFTDAMTIVDDSGRRMRLWIPSEVPPITDREAFMDMLVDRTVKILNNEPIDIYVNPTFLPDSIAADYDALWTETRMKKVVQAAATHHIAIEISSRYKLPKLPFLRMAKAAGCKFTFGTNNGDRDIGRLDYSFQMVRELGLKWQDIWVPKKYLAEPN